MRTAGGYTYTIGDRTGRIVNVEPVGGQHASREVTSAAPLVWQLSLARRLSSRPQHGRTLTSNRPAR